MSRETDEVIAALIDLCREKKVTCIAQVGAEDGSEAWAIMTALEIPGFAVEADSRCLPCTPDLPFFNVAIGAGLELVPFYEHPTLGLSGMFAREDKGERSRAILQIGLDDFCKSLNRVPDALIVDTEGSTLEVLEGATGILKDLEVLYAECQTHAIRPGIRTLDDVEEFLRIFAPHLRRREGLPAYDGGSQGNYTWCRA